jgi:hypothetical protein
LIIGDGQEKAPREVKSIPRRECRQISCCSVSG